jgi:hypothetical protein
MDTATRSYVEDKRDIVALLETELSVVEAGGYGRSPRAPQKPKSMFQYSVACINHWVDPAHPPETCDGCILLDFVPAAHKKEEVPCHFIPLNEAGDTVTSLEQMEDQTRLEKAVAHWLRTMIGQLKAELAQSPS